jgi:hypothetical protein
VLGLLAVALIGIPLALATGGSLRAWTRVRLEWAPLLMLAFATELLLYNPPVDHQAWALACGPLIWIATKLAMLAVFLRNARLYPRLSPWFVAAVGITLNTLVIGLNGGHMPQSLAARDAVWGPNATQLWDQPDRLYNVAPMTDATRLPWLGDVLAEPSWTLRPNVVSVGDLLLAFGMCWWAYGATLGDGRKPLKPQTVSI